MTFWAPLSGGAWVLPRSCQFQGPPQPGEHRTSPQPQPASFTPWMTCPLPQPQTPPSAYVALLNLVHSPTPLLHFRVCPG